MLDYRRQQSNSHIFNPDIGDLIVISASIDRLEKGKKTQHYVITLYFNFIFIFIVHIFLKNTRLPWQHFFFLKI